MIITPQLQNLLSQVEDEKTVTLIKEAFDLGRKDGAAHKFVDTFGTIFDVRDRLDNAGYAEHMDIDEDTQGKILDLDDDTIQRISREIEADNNYQDAADDRVYQDDDLHYDFFESLFQELIKHVNK